jgi:hypothetical protein
MGWFIIGFVVGLDMDLVIHNKQWGPLDPRFVHCFLWMVVNLL